MTTEISMYYRDILHPSVKKVFGNKYWANFKTDMIDTTEKVSKLANNRKLIADKYNLKYISTTLIYPKYINSEYEIKDRYGNKLADHTEVYKNKDNEWVVIHSPYGCLEDSLRGIERQQDLINKGYNIIEPIYSNDAVSFIKIFSKKK